MLNKDESNALVGKDVYCYNFKGFTIRSDGRKRFDYDIEVRPMKITSIHDFDSSENESCQYAWIGNCIGAYYHVRVDDIGNPSVVDAKWISFERNDEQARAVLGAYENMKFADSYNYLMDQVNHLQTQHDCNVSSIQNNAIDDSECREEVERPPHDDVEL